MDNFLWINLINNVSLWLLIIVIIVAIFIFLRYRYKEKYEELKKNYDMKVWLIRTMLDLVNDCVLLIDGEGTILQINKKVEEYYQKPSKKIVGKNIQRLHIDFDYERHQLNMKNQFELGDIYQLVVNYFAPDNTVIPFDTEIHQFIIGSERCYYGIIAKDIQKSQANERFIQKQQEKLIEIEHLAKLGYWEVSHKTNQVSWSRELYSIFGYELNTIKPNLDMLFSIVHPGDQDRVTKAFLDAFRHQEIVDIHHRIFNTKDEIIDVIVRIRHTFSENNEHLSTIGIVQDITEQKELRDSLDYQTRFSKAVLDNTDILVLTLDEKDIILDANPFIEELSGISKNELIGKSAEAIFGQVSRRYMSKSGRYDGPIEMRDVKGYTRSILWNTRELLYIDRRVHVSVGLDVTEGTEYRKKFEHLAYHEPITGLPNRLKLRQVLERYFERNAGKSDKYMALLFISLTHYNEANDLYGYAMGDELVSIVCDRLDTEIGHYGLLARHSDDLLVLFLPNRSAREKIEPICQEIVHILNIPCDIGGLEFVMGGQIGVAKYPEDTSSKEDLLRFADASMNFARKDPNIDYYFFSDFLREKIRSDISMYWRQAHKN